jgi:hypothetical protein
MYHRLSVHAMVLQAGLLLLLAAGTGCEMADNQADEGGNQPQLQKPDSMQDNGTAAQDREQTGMQQQMGRKMVYRAELQPLNESVVGSRPSGTATLTIEGDQLTIEVQANDVPPGIMHLQHYHGFMDGRDARCPTMDDDKNGDGIIDLIETEAVSGKTLVPFHKQPASLQIKAESYPRADAEGSFQYRQTVPLQDLEQAMQQTHNIQSLELDKRVVYIHGVGADANLPDSVQSLPDVPARVTLPIACGELKQVQE